MSVKKFTIVMDWKAVIESNDELKAMKEAYDQLIETIANSHPEDILRVDDVQLSTK